jgi:hypothetical protein
MFLESGWQVLWISHPVSPFHHLKRENRTRLDRARSGTTEHSSGLVEVVPYTYVPFYNAPIFKSRWVLENFLKFTRPPLASVIAKAGFQHADLLWITDTSMHALADIAAPQKVALRIADDNTKFGNTPKALDWAENRLCERADMIFVTASTLEDRLRPQYSARLLLLRNGVDFDHFQGDFSRPDEYRDISGPIAIYVGAIDEWFAPDWIDALATARSDITVVLIGRSAIHLENLKQRANVKWLGPKPYDTIPGFLAHADCAIIPFRRTPLVDSVSPLKLFEFLASGLPVVSARWTELERLSSPAFLADDRDTFVRLVSNAVDQRVKDSLGESFRDFARSNSWKSRFESAMSALYGNSP